MRLLCITDNFRAVERSVGQNVDMVQIRAKHLPARDLVTLVRRAVAVAGSKVLVNTRFDVALVCGAGGVHLPANSVAPSCIRLVAPRDFRIGVSCHTVEELKRAEAEGADFAVYGPVFATGDKRPIGLPGFAEGAAAVKLPVYALGGITWANAGLCLGAGATGVAGISLFEDSPLSPP